MQVGVNGAERAFSGRKGDVGNGGKHDDAADHCQRLNPEEAVAGEDAQKEGSG